MDALPFFSSELQSLVRMVDEVRFDVGDSVVEPGFPCCGIYVIRSGCVSVSTDDLKEKLRLGPKGVFGLREAIENASFNVQVKAVGGSLRCLVINKFIFQKFIPTFLPIFIMYVEAYKRKIQSEIDMILPSDLEEIKLLGAGGVLFYFLFQFLPTSKNMDC